MTAPICHRDIKNSVRTGFDYSLVDTRAMVELFHGGSRRGHVTFGYLNSKGKLVESYADPEYASDYAVDYVLRYPKDSYFCLHRVEHTKRRTVNVRDLTCLYSDLDYHKSTRWSGCSPEAVAAAVLEHCEDHHVPAPSFMMSSGRGLLCVWLLSEAINIDVLPTWKQAQRRIKISLSDFESDAKAVDAVRVFRLAGSINSNSLNPVRMVWAQGSPLSPTRFDFEFLAEELQHAKPCSSEQAKASSEAVKKENKKTAKAVALTKTERTKIDAGDYKPDISGRVMTYETYYSKVWCDLERLRWHRYPDGLLPPGERDNWFLIASVALSWTIPSDQLRNEVLDLPYGRCDWSSDQILSAMGSVLSRTEMAMNGDLIEFSGELVDPRYSFKADTIRQWLSISDDESEQAQLLVLVGERRRNKLSSIRSNLSKHRRNIYKSTHQQKAELRAEIGAQAVLMHDEGCSLRKIAAHFGKSVGYVHEAMTLQRVQK